MMDKATSADGTSIAFERLGEGPPVILIGGALCDRASHRPLAEQLAPRVTGITYDRRGRGDSGDTSPYAVEREVEDLAAVVAAAGGSAAVYGHSSGAGLALLAAIDGVPIDRLVLHEPPFNPDDHAARRESEEYADELDRILADGRPADAVRLFMTVVGMPPEAIEQTEAEPWWPRLVALAPTLAYDAAVMGSRTRGGTVPADELGRVTAPTLVLGGGASPAWMLDIGRQLADGLLHGRHAVLEGEEHAVAPEVLAPVLLEFVTA